MKLAENHVLNVVIVMTHDNRILIGKSLNPDARINKWVYPGGKRRANESIFDAAKRECKEETNINCHPLHIMDIDGVTAYVQCEYLDGKLIPNEEFSELEWVSLTELEKKDLYKNKIKELAANLLN